MRRRGAAERGPGVQRAGISAATPGPEGRGHGTVLLRPEEEREVPKAVGEQVERADLCGPGVKRVGGAWWWKSGQRSCPGTDAGRLHPGEVREDDVLSGSRGGGREPRQSDRAEAEAIGWNPGCGMLSHGRGGVMC
jgi:hypothetical protein